MNSSTQFKLLIKMSGFGSLIIAVMNFISINPDGCSAFTPDIKFKFTSFLNVEFGLTSKHSIKHSFDIVEIFGQSGLLG